MASIRRHRGHWQARVRRKGYPQQTRTFETRAQAQQWARGVERDMDKGEWSDPGEAHRTSLADALDRYRREITPSKKGARQEALRLDLWGRADFASRPLARIRGTDIAEWRDERLKAGASGQTIRNDLSTLSHVYRIARTEWGMAGLHNPCDDVRRPAGSKPRERRLAPGEEKALRQAATPEWDALITLALETGMRRGELLSLTRDQIDRTKRTAHLETTKNGDTRTVPLSPAALRALKALPARVDGRVFGLELDDHGNRWRALCARAGVVGLRFHDLRHEATSRFVESGMWNMAEIAAITGHRTMAMLRRYYHPDAAAMASRMAGKKKPRG
jgi:integrase